MEEKGDGWLIFAAIVLGVAGIMRVFDAIWAFRYHGVLPQNFEDAIFGHSLKTYGWVYLIVAIVLILCAFGVMARSQVSRWIGIFAGAVLSISAIWWMPFYPVWSLETGPGQGPGPAEVARVAAIHRAGLTYSDPRRSPRSWSFPSFARRRSRRLAWSGVSEHSSAAWVRVIWPWASTYCRTICSCCSGSKACTRT